MRQGVAPSSVIVSVVARKGALVAGASLALSASPDTGARPHDPAYVDSPQARAIPDPARADGGGPLSAASREHVEAAQQAREDAARLAEVQRTIQAQVEAVRASQAALPSSAPGAAADRAAAPAPAVGGRSLLREVRAQADAIAPEATDVSAPPGSP